MIEITSQIVRRGFQAYNSAGDGDKVQYHLPAWVTLILASTVLVFVVATFMVCCARPLAEPRLIRTDRIHLWPRYSDPLDDRISCRSYHL
jgi:hypothetical protein